MLPTELSGIDFESDWIAYDHGGAEQADAVDGPGTRRVLDLLASGPVSDLFLMCHGWNADAAAARAEHDAGVRAMADCDADLARAAGRSGFAPLFVGLYWPNQPWADEDFDVPPGARLPAAAMDSQVEAFAGRIADTATARRALRTIFGATLRRSTPGELPRDVRSAYLVLDQESELGCSGPGAAAGHDREPFDPEQRYQAARQNARLGRGPADPINALLAPLRQLAFWKMQDRARRLGASVVHPLLRLLLSARSGMRVHLLGHGFGCVTASAALCGTEQSLGLPRPVHSLVLVQGTLSLWSYCSDIPHRRGTRGYFRSILDGRRVSGPIVATRSRFDAAVSRWFPLGAGAARQVEFASGELPRFGAAGTFGLRGPGLDLVDLDLHAPDRPYNFQGGKVYNLECSRVIRAGGGASGAHRDIVHPELAHAVWSAALA